MELLILPKKREEEIYHSALDAKEPLDIIDHLHARDKILHYAGAAATALVGILHLILVPFLLGLVRILQYFLLLL